MNLRSIGVLRRRLNNSRLCTGFICQRTARYPLRVCSLSDSNRADDPEYIVRLIGRVITVSVETMKIVQALLS